MDPVLNAGLAHFWFVTIHPFDDGNGGIARAIAETMLARSEGAGQRFYSMSAQIREQRSAYCAILERTQRGPLDVTAWLEWLLACIGRAIDAAQVTLGSVMATARSWQSVAGLDLNERQRVILNRLTERFEGELTNNVEVCEGGQMFGGYGAAGYRKTAGTGGFEEERGGRPEHEL
jgi:Fic family protein